MARWNTFVGRKSALSTGNPIQTIQKSHSWSLSNSSRNPLPASFSEHRILDPDFSRDQCWLLLGIGPLVPEQYELFSGLGSRYPTVFLNSYGSNVILSSWKFGRREEQGLSARKIVVLKKRKQIKSIQIQIYWRFKKAKLLWPFFNVLRWIHGSNLKHLPWN